MGSQEKVDDHGLEVLKKAARIPDDTKPTEYAVRVSEVLSSLNIPIPQQFDQVDLTYHTYNEVETAKYYYQSELLRTITLSYDSYTIGSETYYRVSSAVYS